jgi:CheY-like chemotaxis protein
LQQETEEISGPEVLVIDDELFFSVRIETTLKKIGYGVHVVGNREEAILQAERRPPALVIINFGRDSLTPAETVRKLKALPQPAPVLGFVSHIHIPQIRPNAMAAGCDLLVANSALSMRLPQLAAKLAPLDGSQIRVAEAAQVAEEEERV